VHFPPARRTRSRGDDAEKKGIELLEDVIYRKLRAQD
jgi:hypothetical protein